MTTRFPSSPGCPRERRGSHGSAPWPTCSTATTCTVRTWSVPGPEGGPSTATPNRCPPTWRGSPWCGGGCASASGPRARPSGCRLSWTPCGAATSIRTCPGVWCSSGSRPSPAVNSSTSSRPSVATAPSSCSCWPPADFAPGELWRAAGPPPDDRPRTRTDDRSIDAIAQPLLAGWGRSAAGDGTAAGGRGGRRVPPRPRGSGNRSGRTGSRRRSSAGSRAISGGTGGRCPPRWIRAIDRSGSTPARSDARGGGGP